jgi:hypothetical protein
MFGTLADREPLAPLGRAASAIPYRLGFCYDDGCYRPAHRRPASRDLAK